MQHVKTLKRSTHNFSGKIKSIKRIGSTDGYDGHSLRAYSYFGNLMLDIDPNSVDSINSIAVKYPELRQKSKAPTFLLTYAGTHHGLMHNCGFSLEESLDIEEKYHNLYKVSDKFVANKLAGARKDGYITAAFGLRVRTPLLAQTVDTDKHTPYAAKAEARTAGNALGQSWGLLNNRAASAFMEKVRAGNKRWDIKIVCQIHDAQYYLIKDNIETLKWINDNLIECVEWQAHPDIEHSEVHLSGKLSVFYPDWTAEYPIPNRADLNTLKDLAKDISKLTPKEYMSKHNI